MKEQRYLRRDFLKLGGCSIGGGMLASSILPAKLVAAPKVEAKGKIPEKFVGMTPILPTTINEDGSLDLQGQKNLVEYCLACSSVAIGHLAFASEFHKVSNEDRDVIISNLVESVNGRVPIFIGVSSPSTSQSIEFAKRARDLGADMLMLMVPYITIPSWDETRKFYEKVCSATSLPVILQDAGSSSAMMTPERMLQLSKENPNLRYVKPEGGNFLQKVARLMEIGEGRLEVMGGAGGKRMIHMLRLGVRSFMTGTEALDIHAAILKAYVGGDEEKAMRIYSTKFCPYFEFYSVYSEQLLKEMLHMRGIISCPKPLDPPSSKQMCEAERKEFEWVLKQIPFEKWTGKPLAFK